MMNASVQKIQIAVIGGRNASNELLKHAEEVGRLIAQRGATLVCGGMGGVMEAACRGAKAAGGLTVGILPVAAAEEGNPYLDVIIPTGMGLARNAIIINSVSGVIAVDGSYGTLSEMAFALQKEIPVVALKSWDFDEKITSADTPEEAVETLFRIID